MTRAESRDSEEEKEQRVENRERLPDANEKDWSGQADAAERTRGDQPEEAANGRVQLPNANEKDWSSQADAAERTRGDQPATPAAGEDQAGEGAHATENEPHPNRLREGSAPDENGSVRSQDERSSEPASRHVRDAPSHDAGVSHHGVASEAPSIETDDSIGTSEVEPADSDQSGTEHRAEESHGGDEPQGADADNLGAAQHRRDSEDRSIERESAEPGPLQPTEAGNSEAKLRVEENERASAESGSEADDGPGARVRPDVAAARESVSPDAADDLSSGRAQDDPASDAANVAVAERTQAVAEQRDASVASDGELGSDERRSGVDDTQHGAALSRSENPSHAGGVAERADQATQSQRGVVEGERARQAKTTELSEPNGSDSHQDALREVDEDTARRADQCGIKLRELIPPDAWSDGDYLSRSQRLADMSKTTAQALEIAEPTLNLDTTLEHGREFGWSSDNDVGLGDWLLHDSSPVDTIETFAHEYRHQWQDAVIRGDLPHPRGEQGRQELMAGQARYASDLDDFTSYITNPLELDAEAFAKSVSVSYTTVTP